ncbi:MAG: hypothetical protein QXF45_05835 [Candidatus Caldarchaeum sp.]
MRRPLGLVTKGQTAAATMNGISPRLETCGNPNAANTSLKNKGATATPPPNKAM